MNVKYLALATFVAIPLMLTGPAQASPIFSIGEGSSVGWQDAINNGNVRVAANPLSGFAAQQFYNTQIGQNMGNGVVNSIQEAQNLEIAPINPVADSNGEQHDTLVMTWDDAAPDVLSVAAWEYEYGVDPDLRGLYIDFSILPPPGIWDYSLELFDINGRSAGWFGVPPITNWGNFTIFPSLAAPQGPFTAYFEEPLFDLSQVLIIRLNESSQGGIAFDPRPLPLTSPGPWNAWNHLRVVPEPPALLLLGFALAGLAFYRRRTR